MKPRYFRGALLMFFGVGCILAGLGSQVLSQDSDPTADNASRMIEEGRKTFRFDTFGDEVFWGDTLKLHQAIEGSAFGGVGPGVSPATALSVGLKVDADALPQSLVADVLSGRVNLNSPATTLDLLKLN